MLSKEIEEYVINNFNTDKSFQDKIFGLYREYTKLYVSNFENFKNSPKSFWEFFVTYSDFLLRNTSGITEEYLFRNGLAMKRMLEGQISSKLVDEEQRSFVTMVEKIAPKRKSKILDVGPGVVAYSSILFGQDKHNVSAMDKYFWLSDESLSKLKVNAISRYLTQDASIDDYDIVVGKLPCSAIDTIVYLCKKYNKPYFIETCDCEMPTMEYFYKKWNIHKTIPIKKQPNCTQGNSGKFCSLEEPVVIGKDDWISWERMLPELDNDIGFYGSYVFNVGSKKDVCKIIAKNINRLKKSREDYKGGTVFSISVANSNNKWFKAEDEKEID